MRISYRVKPELQRQAKVNKIMAMNASFKSRLNALLACDSNKGQHWA